jgi:hypothetical protein
MIDLTQVGGKLLAATENTDPAQLQWNFGWIPPDSVNAAVADLYWLEQPPERQALRPAINAAHADTVRTMPVFRISGNWQMDQQRVALWKAGPKLLNGKFLPYDWQLTGSCVGAGGDNMRKTLLASEIVYGGRLEEFRIVFWPFTYGISRMLDGSHGRGEGSTGSSWAKAASQYGSFAVDETAGLPQFKMVQDWLQLTEQIEYQWSYGGDFDPKYLELGKHHLIKTVAPCKDHADVTAALVSGHAITQASNFGFAPMVPTPHGNPPVRLVSWNGSWSHQTYIDEVWDHPTLGLIFRWGNNWGPDAHGPALADEPPSSVYIKAATLDEICRSGEVYAFSAYDGFPARKIDWTA